ncbi:MAG: PorV/PorQ family protein, partial [Calditrichaeota bacterium]
TSAAQFLKISVGPRASSLGGSFTAVSNDASSLFWNPAGAAWINKRQFMASHTEWFADINHEFAGLILPLSSATVVGVSFTSMNAPDMEQTTLEQPEGTGIFFDVQDIAFGLTLSRRMTERFSFGVTVKYIQQRLFNESASTFAVDLGGMLLTGFRGMRLGIMMSNFGGKLRLDGRDLIVPTDRTAAKMETESWPLPISFRLGLALDLIGLREGIFLRESQRLTLMVDGYNVNDAAETVSVGMEYSWNENFFLRGGYRINHDTEDFSTGAGVQFPVQGWMVQTDYSLSNMGNLGYIHKIGLGFQF